MGVTVTCPTAKVFPWANVSRRPAHKIITNIHKTEHRNLMYQQWTGQKQLNTVKLLQTLYTNVAKYTTFCFPLILSSYTTARNCTRFLLKKLRTNVTDNSMKWFERNAQLHSTYT